eukprot:TRINITY_DN831_c0_g1_i20.p2 TRINITY_DN831_c0_g1~~TRINITY_DN831_c0_g1_i20.p2  ORF type:complete len:531 (+),score=22.41 TRINITY_DN831_c0_g1_i20:590-2182(+)
MLGHGFLDQGVDGRCFPIDCGDAGCKLGQGRAGVIGKVLGQQFRVGGDVGVENFDGISQDVQRVAAVDIQNDGFFQVGAVGRIHAASGQSGLHLGGQFGGWQQLHVMLVQPQQFFGIELGGGSGDVVEIEPFDELLARKDFVIAMRPAEAGEIIDNGFGQETFVVVLHDRNGTVALRQLGAVIAEDHRQVGVGWHFGAECLKDVDLARGVVDMVVTADDVGDAHIPVIDADAEIVGRCAVGAGDDQVVQFRVGKLDVALDLVIPGNDAALRILEADYWRNICGRSRQVLARFRAPATVIARLFLLRFLFGAQGIELFTRRVAVIRAAIGEHLLDDFLVALHALHLVERAFVMFQSQPLHAIQNGLNCFRRRASDIRILYAQDKGATVAAGVGPGEQGGTGAADMQVTGGAGGKTGADWLHGVQNLYVGKGGYSIRPEFDPLPDLWLNARLSIGRLAQYQSNVFIWFVTGKPPHKATEVICKSLKMRAQLRGRASPSHGGGRGFETLRSHQENQLKTCMASGYAGFLFCWS